LTIRLSRDSRAAPGTEGWRQLRHGLGLDLADALPGHAVDLADLVERAWLPVGEPEPQPYDTGFALGQRLQHGLQLILQQVKLTASTATTASESSMKSPSCESPSSPIVWSSEMGSRAYCWISSTFSG